MRVISLVVAGFLFLSTLESWAGFWILGRWYVSSRFASVSLGTVKSWLDRGIVRPSTQTGKVIWQSRGKGILLTLGLSQVISEVRNLQSSTQLCYIARPDLNPIYAGWTSWRTLSVHDRGVETSSFYTVSYSSSCSSGSANLPVVQIRRWEWVRSRERYEWIDIAEVPASGTYMIGQCSVSFSLRNVSRVCPSSRTQAPADVDWNQRRRVPVRVFPNLNDFLRPDVIENDPALRWLRDEYNRIASDPSIPTIPSDALGDLELPSVDWSIAPDEAIDHASERGSTRESEGSREGDLDLSFPGLNTGLEVPVKKPFPVELINQLVQNHPLLRILRGVSLDAAGGGSCVFGSQPFIIDMCGWAWVLNLMGSFLVPLAFLYGLGIGGRND